MMYRARFVMIAACLIFVSGTARSAESKTWMRYPAISPDGKQIAFSYRGDLWIVGSEGGTARLLTSHTAYERSPVWSPDSTTIAFASDRHGNFDVFTIPAAGGQARRLTYHSAADEPTSFTRDGRQVLLTSRRLDAPQAAIGNDRFGELYSISIDGGRPVQIMTTTAHHASFDPDSDRLVFHDYKGYEDNWQKHHTSSVTRDIWTFEPKTSNYTRLTRFNGEDRNPVWSPDGKSIFYLSEEGGTFNVWQMNPDTPEDRKQVTRHHVHPVRFLTVAEDGTLAYGYNGEIWIQRAGAEPQRLEIAAPADRRRNEAHHVVLNEGATEIAVSPDEEEVAFVVRGEVFVTSVEFGTTRRITNTPEQERSISYSKDGRTLYYAGERNGSWNIYKTTITREDEESFSIATLLTEQPILETDDETFQPLVSPDGKQLAFLKNRTEIMVLDLATKKSSTLIPGKKNNSYTDGDISYAWSPDSRWLTATYHGHKSWVSEIAAVQLATGEIVNVTNSGYGEDLPQFSADGKALLYISDRYGERSHGGHGSENDVIALYLTQETYDEAVLDKEALARKKKRAKKDKENGEKDQPRDKKTKDGDKEDSEANEADDEKPEKDEKEIEPVKFETEDRQLRVRRLTLMSSPIGSYDLSPDGESLLYTAQVENEWGLWLCKVRDRSTKKLLPLGGESARMVLFAKDGKSVFLMKGGGGLEKVEVGDALSNGGQAKSKAIAYAAEMTIDGPRQREYVFEHAWRQVARKFYDPKMHGVDWLAMKKNYGAFLPTITNNHDFAELLSEMLGELNASHTGCRFRPRVPQRDQTAALGLLYDIKHDGVGLKVAEVIKRGPADKADCKIAGGHIITHIDGERLTPEKNPWRYLNRKAGKPVRLTLHDPAAENEWEEVIRPISHDKQSNLLYERWIASRRDRCEELSGGRIGYVHVESMGDASFRRVYSEVLGLNNEKEALIVDTRFNGGGWLHEHLATFLSGKRYCYFVPRGHEAGDLGGEPIGKWTRPVVVLQSESNYSDAHFFPWAFQTKGVGKLVGAPVPGTTTAVWWEQQIDPTLVFGIPQVGIITLEGKYLENQQLEPDVLVINDPESVAKGEDKQLAKAVEVLVNELDAASK